MTRKIVLTLILLTNSLHLKAQDTPKTSLMHSIRSILAKDKHRNTMRVYASQYFYPEVQTKTQIKNLIKKTPSYYDNWGQIGIEYSRQIHKRYSVAVAYYRWNNTHILRPPFMPRSVFIPFNNTPEKLGLRGRWSLQFYDVDFGYRLLQIKKHCVTAKLGLSFQNGYTQYTDSVVGIVDPAFNHSNIYGHYEYKEYFGYTPSIIYDYLFLKKWLCIGANIGLRRYFNYGNYTQVEYGIHMGVNF